MKLQDISNLIAVRTFAAASIDNLSIKMSRDEARLLSAKSNYLDQQIIKAIIELNVEAALAADAPVVKVETVIKAKKQLDSKTE